ncbi:MAG: alanine--tRNA ligase, partial [Actinobacteria bacterium]|nr:alanine--tRNA ligase [Actinomycetota bacterium]
AIGAMGPQYPELIEKSARIIEVSVNEEESFLATLKSGTQIFDLAAKSAKSAHDVRLGGETAFKLHDTYGFPFDLTLEMAAEQGLAVDEDGFRKLMKEQKDRAKADARAKKSGHTDLSEYRKIVDSFGKTQFLGYSQTQSEAKVCALLIDGKSLPESGATSEIEIVLDRTPFYAEGGGQLPDGGIIRLANGAVVEIDDVQSPVPGLYVHRGSVLSGVVKVSDTANATIDLTRRLAISRAHTATHMVHKAFREALGESATQAGSENAPGRFRFDFPATGAVPPSVLRDVEARVNALLLEDLAVTAQTMTQPEAKAMGAMALFGEKYGDEVRVVSVGDWAHELCGGTHVSTSGQLGLVKLLSEASIGAGVRRVEALVGVDAFDFLAREHVLLNSLTEIIKGARVEELPERISHLVEQLKSTEKELGQYRTASILASAGDLVKNAQKISDIDVIAGSIADGVSVDDLRTIAMDLRNRVKNGVVALTSITDGRVTLVVAVSEQARTRGIKAGSLVKTASTILGGGGGGKDDFAQGGGTKVEALPTAVKEILSSINATIGT